MAPVPQQLVDALTARHLAAQGNVLQLVGGQLGRLLAALPDLSDESRDRYVAAAVSAIAAGQRRSAILAAAYARAIAPARDERRPLQLQLDELAVTAATAWVASPIIVGRRELGNGATWASAIELATSKAIGYTAGDLAVAQRHGIEAGARSTGAELRGYRKVPAGGACKWCLAVAADRVYRSASSVPFHEHDSCTVAPVFAGGR